MTTATKSSKAKNSRQPVIEQLGHLLAVSADLYSQVKQAHWTVVGPGFIAVHRLFDEQAAMLSLHVDHHAERMRAIGAIPKGTVRGAVEASDLPEIEIRELVWDEAVTMILERFERYAELLHDGIDAAEEHEDPATENMLTDELEELDTQMYFLRSYLGGENR